MTDRGGRPKIETPATAEATRLLIAHEVVHQNRPTGPRSLYRLHKAFVAAGDAARLDAKNAALAEENRLKAAALELRKAEYRLRFAQKPLGVRSLLAESERLKERIRTLEMELGKNTVVNFDCDVMSVGVKSATRGLNA
jgi:hypothetical protein